MEEVKKVFNRFDTNHDGKISSTELISIMKSLGSDTSEDEVKQMMTKIDTDNDGYITLEEFAGFCKDDTADDGGMKELHEAFELYDLNNNGLISSTELHQILTRWCSPPLSCQKPYHHAWWWVTLRTTREKWDRGAGSPPIKTSLRVNEQNSPCDAADLAAVCIASWLNPCDTMFIAFLLLHNVAKRGRRSNATKQNHNQGSTFSF
ncbi:calcium-binding allergen Ole e 8 [Artemisia annua]|uniref:Calcium-binding allergen Ole e 8 n=1 Tax=Artemisia annua TaxID=35608 RepID=A0A2U1Q8R4_ARTAN|nr:calcium-binding allergen Ole e 8 [Artemisia annua]